MTALCSDDAHWVAQCRAGDSNAFEPLVHRYQNAAYAVALTYLRRRPEAQDLVQEAFITAYCQLQHLRSPASFGSWFRTIVVSHCQAWLRRQAGRAAAVVSIEDATPELDEVATVTHRKQEAQHDVWRAIDRLPEPNRLVVLLHYISGFSYDDIARFLDLPVSTVRGRLQQSRVRLKEALSDHKQEVLTMSPIDVTKDVQEVICRIVKERIHQAIPMEDTRHIVLYCGIETDVDIHQAEGDEIVLEGTKMAVGFSVKDARGRAAKLELLADQVENFLETGPHAGESFAGVYSNDDGKTSTKTVKSRPLGEHWTRDLDVMAQVMTPLVPYPSVQEVYPSLQAEVDALTRLPDWVQTALGRVTRLTVCTQTVDPIEIPRRHYTGRIQRLLSQWWADQHSVLGPAGYVHLRMAIPRGVTLTVFRARRLTASRLTGSLQCFLCQVEELTDIDGDIFLSRSRVKAIRQVHGRVYQRDFGYGGTFESDGHLRRMDPEACEIAQVTGEVDLDVGRLTLTVSDVDGTVRLRNRFGDTRLTQRHADAHTRCWLESRGGAIHLTLSEDLFQKINVTLQTLSGTITRSPSVLHRPYSAGYGHDLITISTIAGVQAQQQGVMTAEYHLKTESGAITLETIPASVTKSSKSRA